MIGALTGNNNIELYIQVRGASLESLVQTSQEVKTAEKGYFDLREYKMKHRKDQIIRNCVDPNVGQYVLGCAFS